MTHADDTMFPWWQAICTLPGGDPSLPRCFFSLDSSTRENSSSNDSSYCSSTAKLNNVCSKHDKHNKHCVMLSSLPGHEAPYNQSYSGQHTPSCSAQRHRCGVLPGIHLSSELRQARAVEQPQVASQQLQQLQPQLQAQGVGSLVQRSLPPSRPDFMQQIGEHSHL